MYQAAIANAKASGEASKARRYDRGLKVTRQHNAKPVPVLWKVLFINYSNFRYLSSVKHHIVLLSYSCSSFMSVKQKAKHRRNS